jgi:hypothetical protein
VNPVTRPSASQLWGDIRVTPQSWNNVFRASFPNGDASSWIQWKLPIGAGTWDISVTYASSPDAAIMTASLDGTDVGTIDGYADPSVFNVQGEINNVTVASSGMHTLRIRTDSKNASSSGYFGYLIWIRLVQN